MKKIQILIILMLFFLLGITVFFIPPSHPVLIVLFISGCSLLSVSFVRLWLSRKDSYIIGAFILMFLSFNSIIGFDWLNIILLVSFVLGIRFLVQ